ncbi:unnamed protein product, partial [Mesorhabditis belari]|uniref:Lysosomal-associated transmembrane protein 4A n=1 Tax=Mesorhabditis belari TaxID=2138241 RepID=A0AAF3EDB6_9BILA
MAAPIPCSNLKTAGIVVAVVEVVLCILAAWGLSSNFVRFGGSYFIWWLIGIISVVILLLAIALMLYAICRENSRWMIPHLSAQIFLILFLVVVVIIVTFLLIFQAYRGIRNLLGITDYYMNNDSTVVLGVLLIVINLVVAILECFFLFICWKLYKQLQQYEALRKGYPSDNLKRSHWTTVGKWPVDDKHGSPDMGHLYLYNQENAENSGYGYNDETPLYSNQQSRRF